MKAFRAIRDKAVEQTKKLESFQTISAMRCLSHINRARILKVLIDNPVLLGAALFFNIEDPAARHV